MTVGRTVYVIEKPLKAEYINVYKAGQLAYLRFIESIHAGHLFPFQSHQLGQTELNLAFFIVSLLLMPSIAVGKTIVANESHVKYMFRSEGCREEAFITPFL